MVEFIKRIYIKNKNVKLLGIGFGAHVIAQALGGEVK